MKKTRPSRNRRAAAGNRPVVAGTWPFAEGPVRAALRALRAGQPPVYAVTAGAEIVELDPRVASVGIGGLPDASGEVTLDACVMDGRSHRFGAVAALPGIPRATAVARLVMDLTPHCILAGEGARRFALEQGFEERSLLTPESRRRWKEWLATPSRRTPRPAEGHDTLGLLALSASGDLAGACTTSGIAWKTPGRVGDSPIPGAGLFVDNEVGAAVGTGLGEEILQSAGALRVVEGMARGRSPGEACRDALRYLLRKRPGFTGQAAFLALRRDGALGAAALRAGFVCWVARGAVRRVRVPALRR